MEETYLARLEVEVGGIKLIGLGKIGDTHAEMPEFVHWRGAFNV